MFNFCESIVYLIKKKLVLLGRRHLQVRLVEPSLKSLNSGDCFALVTEKDLFSWIGKDCNPYEKAKVSKLVCGWYLLSMVKVNSVSKPGGSSVGKVCLRAEWPIRALAFNFGFCSMTGNLTNQPNFLMVCILIDHRNDAIKCSEFMWNHEPQGRAFTAKF